MFKVRETLILQDILQRLRNPDVREDFETGRNGAVKLEADDLVLLDKLLAEGFVSIGEADTKESFEAHAHRAADHWVSTVDGKPKQFTVGITYERVRRIVRSIQDSQYFEARFATSTVSQDEDEAQAVHATNGGDGGEDEEEAGEEEQQLQQSDEATQESSNTATPTSSMSTLSSAVDAPNVNGSEAQALCNPLPAAAAATPNESHTPISVLQQHGHQPLPAPHHPQLVMAQACPMAPAVHDDPNTLPEELASGAFSFLQDSELDEQMGMGSTVPVHENGQHTMHGLQNGHASPGLRQQQQQPQPIPTQPPTNMLLINPMLSMPGLHQATQAHVDQMVNGGGAVVANGIGGGVTPPMFAFPFQNAGVANVQMANASVALGAQQQAHLNPVQQLVKTLNAANFHHHQLPAAPLMMQQQPQQQPQLNTNGHQHRVVTALPPGHSVQSVAAHGYVATHKTPANNAVAMDEEKATVAVEHTPPHVSNTEQMTISEWDPVGKTTAANGHEKRETSAESSTGERRRTDDHRRPGRHDNGGGGGFNGSRRRYGDRPQHASGDVGGTGGAANNSYNGSRMHRNGGGAGSGNNGPVDGENGPSASASFRQSAKPHHYNRMSNGGAGGGAGGAGSNGNSGSTFYRNNDPNYYTQNGMKSASVRHTQQGHQGFNQQRPTPAGNRN